MKTLKPFTGLRTWVRCRLMSAWSTSACAASKAACAWVALPAYCCCSSGVVARSVLDDPKQRQRYVKYMSAREKEQFAKHYVRHVLEAKENELWFKRMALKK